MRLDVRLAVSGEMEFPMRRSALVVALAWLLTAGWPSPGGARDRDAEVSTAEPFVADRELSRRFEQARELLRGDAAGRVNALRLLQSVLDAEEDAFVPVPEPAGPRFTGLKALARQLLAELDEEDRRLYELEFGTQARARLRAALDPLDLPALEEVARRFFHTPAGHEAASLLASYHLSCGQPAWAAVGLERLAAGRGSARNDEPLLWLRIAVAWHQAGEPAAAGRALQDVRRRTPSGRLLLAGKTLRLPDEGGDVSAWLERHFGPAAAAETEPAAWRLFRGNESRNGMGAAVVGVGDVLWRAAPLEADDFPRGKAHESIAAESLQLLEAHYRAAEWLTAPAAHPLVMGGAVIVRSAANIKALDLRSGTTLWKTAWNEASFEAVFDHDGRLPAPGGRVGTSPLELLLAQRAWLDATAGMLSSDGRFVYAVEDLGFLGISVDETGGPQHPLAPAAVNRLTAFELAADGRAAWSLGGSAADSSPGLARTFFLGPPLPLNGRLYVLAETAGEIGLVCLDVRASDAAGPSASPAVPAVAWSQPLVFPEQSVLAAPRRRLSGASPSFAGGVLICPTVAGAVAAVDVARRELRWGYRYDSTEAADDDPRAEGPAVFGGNFAEDAPLGAADRKSRWLDAVPLIADGYVLVTPRDSDRLHCLQLADGMPAWTLPRGDGLFVATVGAERVVVVGKGQVAAYRLRDGRAAWSEPLRISLPGGYGVCSGRLYHLPLADGRIVTLDLQTGRLLHEARLPQGLVPGNLVAVGDVIVVQSPQMVFALKPVLHGSGSGPANR